MTPSPPGQAIHFRGESLSPESPLPLHYPEPSKIPVLENQIDPVFNDTATYQNSQNKPVEMPTIFNFETPTYTPTSALSEIVNQISDQNSVENGLVGNTLDSIHSEDQEGKGSYPMSLDLGEQAPDNQPASSDLFAQVGSGTFDDAPSDNKLIPSGYVPLLSDPHAFLDPSSHASSNETTPTVFEPPPNAEQATTSLNEALSGAINLLEDHTNADVSHAEEGANQAIQDAEGANSQPQSGNLSPSTAIAPSAAAITTATTSSPREELSIPEASNEPSLPSPAGLPPRPPPQEKPSMHPNYAASDDIRTYHQFHSQTPNAQATYPSQASNAYRPGPSLPPPMPNAGAPGTTSSSNGLPPPHIVTTFPQPSSQHPLPQQPLSAQGYLQRDGPDSPPIPMSAVVSERGDDDVPWGPEIQKKYDDFIHQERVYVTEGLWDRFPNGSRLFIGNLPTEKVTKRDLFHVFHRHGKLAQISIKQAYGFVQFLETAACQQALQQEQNQPIRGRKMHLEISKPQKNTRNAGQDGGRGGQQRREQRRRSPDYGRGAQRGGGERFDRGREPSPPRFSDFRDEHPRRRDDYRPMRSPSPRGPRGRGDNRKRERSPEVYDRRRRDRSRSPDRRGGRFRSPTPPTPSYDVGDLPFPRRAPSEVPDVQIIISEELDRGFLGYIDKSFRDRGLRTDVLLLPPRVGLEAAVRRQILEGVHAVIKLERASYYSGTIPLQVFDRSSGADNVRYDEYNDLNMAAAAELVIRAKQTQAAIPAQPQYPLAVQPYLPQYPPVPPQQPSVHVQHQPPAGSNITNLISNLDASGLQRLLGALQQPPPQPQQPTPVQHAPTPTTPTTDLAGLLSTVARQQQNQQQQYPQPSYGQPPPQQQPPVNPYAGLASNPAFANNPAFNSLFSGNQQHPPQPAQNPQNYRNPQGGWN